MEEEAQGAAVQGAQEEAVQGAQGLEEAVQEEDAQEEAAQGAAAQGAAARRSVVCQKKLGKTQAVCTIYAMAKLELITA